MSIFISRDADIEASATEFMLPAMDGMRAIHFLNDTIEKAARNYAPDGPAAAVVGLPVVGNGFMTFRGATDFIQTRVQETPAQTLYAVARTNEDLSAQNNRPHYISTFTSAAAAGGGATFGAAIYPLLTGGTDVVQAIGSRGTAVANHINGQVTTPIVPKTSFALIAVVIPAGSAKNRIYNLTAQAMAEATAANTPRFPSLGYFRIGSSMSVTSFLGTCDMAFAAIASEAHSEAQVQANGEAIRRYLSGRGINV